MDRDTAVSHIKEGLGFRTDLDDRIVLRLQRVQDLLEQGKTLPWFLIEEGVTIAVTAGNDATIPDGFIREVEYEHALHYRESLTTAPVYLRKVGYDEGLDEYGDASDGDVPVAYSIRKTTFRLFPRTTAAVTLYWDYYKRADPLTSNIENPWLANSPWLLIGNAGASIAKTLRNKGAESEFTEVAQAAWDAVMKENALRQSANRTYILGRNT